MYKKSSTGWFKHIDFILIDMACMHLAFVLAYGVRFHNANPYANDDFVSMAVVLSIISLLVALVFDSFKNVLKRGRLAELSATVKQIVLVELVMAFYLFSTKQGAQYSRLVLYLLVPFYVLLGYGVRQLWKIYLRKRVSIGQERRMVVVGWSNRLPEIITNVQKNSFDAVNVVGAVAIDQNLQGEAVGQIPIVADVEGMYEYVCREWVDEVLISLPATQKYPEKMIGKFQQMGIVVHYTILQMPEEEAPRQIVERIGSYTVLTSSMSYVSPFHVLVKRLMDILGGLVGSLITLFLCVFIGPLIYINSPGPILFTQERVGKNGRKFKIYKFRTMYPDAEERKKELMEQNNVKDGMMFKMDFDPRIIGNKTLSDGRTKTGVGQFLRNTSLDEFPQFFNILKGDMSLVGTRPPTLDEWEKYELHHRARLAIRPGLTGLWQVSGRSNITDFEEVVRLDTKYINEWSIGLDVKILVKTVAVVFKSDGAR